MNQKYLALLMGDCWAKPGFEGQEHGSPPSELLWNQLKLS